MLSLPEITPRQTYALLTALSCLTLAPVASVMEYLGAGASRLATAGVAPRRHGCALVRLSCEEVSSGGALVARKSRAAALSGA